MGDLMKGSYSFDNLLKTYNSFITPVKRIKINGKEIGASLEVGVTDLDVTLSLEGSSSVNFTIYNVYDLEKHSFLSNVKSKLILGSKITIELGYESTYTLVFSGYIASIAMEFTTMPKVTVTALDIRRLMMNNERYESHKATVRSTIFTNILKDYTSICPNKVVTGMKDEKKVLQQNESDYSFIMNQLIPGSKREFFVMGDTAYFRVAGATSTPIMTLEWGKGLIAFTLKKSYLNEVIDVRSDDDSNKAISAQKQAQTEKSVKKTVSPLPKKKIINTDINTKEEATALAEYEAVQRMMECQTGSGTCIGLPEIVPGRYLKIKGLDDSVNKTYYLKEVSHSFGADGFTTEFDIGGWK